MQLPVAVRAPFSFARTLGFVRSFPPCQADFVVGDDALSGAMTVGDRAVAFTLRGDRALTLETDAPEVADRVADLIGARDELAPFYAAAAGDRAFAPLVARLHGLHHVRFRSLEEVTVYSVMMQRTPVRLASQLKRRFLAGFGLPAAGTALRTMPGFARLVELDGAAIAAAIGHATKGEAIARAIRGVAAIDAALLRDGPYAEARAALLAVPGLGPFSAGAILLRGLGRMDELPGMRWFEREARAVYGGGFDERAVRARYGRQIGYWAYYLKTGVGRQPLSGTRSP
jgi:DNA-3-methyladenine glycosylase II